MRLSQSSLSGRGGLVTSRLLWLGWVGWADVQIHTSALPAINDTRAQRQTRHDMGFSAGRLFFSAMPPRLIGRRGLRYILPIFLVDARVVLMLVMSIIDTIVTGSTSPLQCSSADPDSPLQSLALTLHRAEASGSQRPRPITVEHRAVRS